MKGEKEFIKKWDALLNIARKAETGGRGVDESSPEVFIPFVETFKQYAPPEEYPRILDIGAGCGAETKVLMDAGYDVVGITFGEDNIRAEIYIYYGKARNTAKKLGVSYKDYLLRLFVHGICHLLGYKHGTDQEAQEMEEVEKKLLRPYLKKRTLSQMFE